VLPPPASDDPRLRLLALTGALVAHDPPTVVEPAGAGEAADVLIDFLVRHGYLAAVPDGGVAPSTGDPSA
jgi:electron transfer flavoprotein beta subunit